MSLGHPQYMETKILLWENVWYYSIGVTPRIVEFHKYNIVTCFFSRFKHAVYHELGKYESTDIISVAK